jgi:hypothetical protein
MSRACYDQVRCVTTRPLQWLRGKEGALQIAGPGPSTHAEAYTDTQQHINSTPTLDCAPCLLTLHFGPARLAQTNLPAPGTPAAVSTIPLKLGRGL